MSTSVISDTRVEGLLDHVTQIIAGKMPYQETINRIGTLLVYSVSAASLAISLRDPMTGGVLQYSLTRGQSRESGQAAHSSFSQTVRRGGAPRGHIELKVADSGWSHASLLHLVEALADQLAALPPRAVK